MYLTTNEVKERYRVSRGTIYRWMKNDHYPAPMLKPRIGGSAGNNRWLEFDLDEWEARCQTMMRATGSD